MKAHIYRKKYASIGASTKPFRKNARIELGYCCAQFLAGLLTVRFGMGLVGAALMIALCLVYILYVNPRFMSRRLTR